VKEIESRGVALRVVDITAPEQELASGLAGIDILISAIGPHDLLQQKTLVRAAKSAGVKRFVPCAFITVAPPKGAMLLRDEVLECPAILRRKKKKNID
jgi:hypothetical protein